MIVVELEDSALAFTCATFPSSYLGQSTQPLSPFLHLYYVTWTPVDLFGRFLWGMEEVTFLVPSKYWVCGLSSSNAQRCRLLWASPASLDAGCQEGVGLAELESCLLNFPKHLQL